MNFDGLLSSWVRKVTMYVLATAGGIQRESQARARGVVP
jgi:hypothetical protein